MMSPQFSATSSTPGARRPSVSANMRPLRILLGTVEVSGTIPDYADGFRQLGHSVTTAISHSYKQYPDVHADIDVSPESWDTIHWPKWIAEAKALPLRLPRGAANRAGALARLIRLISQHDVFFFQWGGTTLVPGRWDLPL